MCILVWASGLSGEYNFILAGNRDEYFDRETSTAAFWHDLPHLLAGRDLRRGGTWLGITKDGRFAALTNVRTPFETIRADAKSRGDLLLEYFSSTGNAGDFLKRVASEGHLYNAFNIVVGRVDQGLWYYGTNTGEEPKQLQPQQVRYSIVHILFHDWSKLKGKEVNGNLVDPSLTGQSQQEFR